MASFNGRLKPVAALLILAVAVLATASGCTQTTDIYRWGEYEDLVYAMYVKPGTADPGTQALELAEDVARTESEHRRVPPGVHAHLGYLYYLQGNIDAAFVEFQTEKELFPESTVFIDGMIARMARR
jgi:hypothetical protein